MNIHFKYIAVCRRQALRDRQKLHWFQRFLEDQKIKKEGKDSHSSGLFTLRSAKLAWKKDKDKDKDKDKGEPWNANRLVLYCTVDTRFWSAEGTQLARKEKEAKLLKTIDNMKEKGELNANQQAFVQKKHATLAKLHNSFPRPSRQLYQGKPNIILGVAMGLDKPATVAIVDGNTGNAIASYIGHNESSMNNLSVALDLNDLKIDLQDIEKFMENLDRRLTKIENKNKPKESKDTCKKKKLNDYEKSVIDMYVRRCLDSESIITTKDILQYLNLDPTHQGLQQQVTYLLKSEGLTKVRKRVEGKLTYYMVGLKEMNNYIDDVWQKAIAIVEPLNKNTV
ncbi:MAG: type V CRISPR-associated protein Cas12k [Xenococcaceae cyanobacterium MO_188.B19]|nr:type V CRISPR-associated protein Cas12k [Xenococcaceae cyanobacterium MO_188.B19]